MQGQGGGCVHVGPLLSALYLGPAGACSGVLGCWAFVTPAPLFFCSEIMSAHLMLAAAASAASLVT